MLKIVNKKNYKKTPAILYNRSYNYFKKYYNSVIPLDIYPSFFKSNNVNIFPISSFENIPVLKPYAFFNFNYSTIKSSILSGLLKHIAVHKSSNNSITLCFLKYSSAYSFK